MKTLENQDPNDEQQDSNDEKIKFATRLARNRFAKIDIFCALDSFRRQFKCLGKNQCNRKTERNHCDENFHRPRRRFESRKQDRRRLQQQPRDNRVGNGDLVDIAPL